MDFQCVWEGSEGSRAAVSRKFSYLLPGEADGLVLEKGFLEAGGAARASSELQKGLQHSWSHWQQWKLLFCVSHHPLSCTRLTRGPALWPLKSIGSSRFVFGHRRE